MLKEVTDEVDKKKNELKESEVVVLLFCSEFEKRVKT